MPSSGNWNTPEKKKKIKVEVKGVYPHALRRRLAPPALALPAYSAEVASGYVGRAEGEGNRHAFRVIPPPSRCACATARRARGRPVLSEVEGSGGGWDVIKAKNEKRAG